MIQTVESLLKAQPFCPAPCLTHTSGFVCPGGRCLVTGARDGHPEAGERVFARLYPPVLQRARRLSATPPDAEDLAQTALLQAFQGFHQLRDCHRVLSWVWRIVENAHRMSRRACRVPPGATVEFCESTAPPRRNPFDQPDEIVLAWALEAQAAAIFNQLPSALRQVFELRVLDGRNTAETALRLRISNDAVRTRLTRARRAFTCAFRK